MQGKKRVKSNRDHELDDVDLSEIVPDRITSIRVITPLGKGILLQRRASDGFHEVELDNWKAIIYIKAIAITLTVKKLSSIYLRLLNTISNNQGRVAVAL